MKKLCVFSALLVLGTLLFAEKWEHGEECVKRFYEDGKYIAYTRNDNNTYYMDKSDIKMIRVDENDIEIYQSLHRAWPFNLFVINRHLSFHMNRYDVSNDENGNLIIVRN